MISIQFWFLLIKRSNFELIPFAYWKILHSQTYMRWKVIWTCQNSLLRMRNIYERARNQGGKLKIYVHRSKSKIVIEHALSSNKGTKKRRIRRRKSTFDPWHNSFNDKLKFTLIDVCCVVYVHGMAFSISLFYIYKCMITWIPLNFIWCIFMNTQYNPHGFMVNR